MDLTRLRHIVEIHRPLGAFSSLPFAIEQNGELIVSWFAYDMTQYGSISELVVKGIYTIDRAGIIHAEPINTMSFMLNNNEVQCISDDDFDESEYYKEFVMAFNSNDTQLLNELLNKSEVESSLSIYQAVKEHNAQCAYM
jgi:hypothetical protein